MPTTAEILDALQFDMEYLSGPINTSGAAAYRIEYQFAGGTQPGDLWNSYSGWTAMSAAERAAMRAAMDHIESIVNITFVEVTGRADPDMNLGKVAMSGSTAGLGGYRYSTIGGSLADYDNFTVFDKDLDLSQDRFTGLILHEIGHALALRHPFNAPVLPEGFENNKYTVMSYSPNPDIGKDADALQLFDILALQDRWGANLATRTGDDIYTGPRVDTVDPIWDAGGYDRLDASARGTAVRLDLTPGAFSQFSGRDDVVIPFGVVIEAAIGGAGADTITGNSADNYLSGNAQNDWMDGGDGADTIYGDSGNDTLYGGAGADLLVGGPGGDTIHVDNPGDRVSESRKWAGLDTVFASVDFRMGNRHIEDLRLEGTAVLGAGNGLMNRIWGNDQDNILDGGKNVDTLIGGLGDDIYLLRAPGDNAVEEAGGGIDAVKAFRSIALDAHVEKLFIQTLRNAAGDGINGTNGIGNGLDNTIVGNPFDNTLSGREGRDTLKGQGGADSFVFDRAIGTDNVDRIVDFDAAEGDNLLLKASLFGGLPTGALAAASFLAGGVATTAAQRLLFDQAAGALYFDADGSGAAARQLVATFDGGITLDASDFTLF